MQSLIEHRPPVEVALQALEALAPLAELDRAAMLAALQGQTEHHRTGADMGDSGDPRCWILIQGWACQVRLLPDGRRQVFNFLMPGDIVGLRKVVQPSGLYRIVALTACVTLHARGIIEDLGRGEASSLAQASMQFERRQIASLFDHIIRLGARTAFEATANLFLELYSRAAAFEQCESGRISMPVSQIVLSDALGVSPVQMNRILTRMRREGLLSFGAGWVEIPDLAALAKVACMARAVQA